MLFRSEEPNADTPGADQLPQDQIQSSQEIQQHDDAETGSLFLILYGLCQIPLAQGQTPRKNETMETTQTWKSQESGAGTEGSLRETQDNPAPTHSGIVNKKGKIDLYAQIPPQNQVNEFVFTVMSDNQPLCALTFRQNYEHAHRKDRCELHIQFNSMKWCLS